MLLKFGVLNIKERRVHLPEDDSWGNNTDQESSEERQLVREIPPVQEAPRRVRGTGTRASDIRTLSRGVEAASEGAPYERQF